MKIETLKRPGEFKRVRGGVRWATPLFIIEGRRRVAASAADALRVIEVDGQASGPRFGFTITRKVGNAVVRNRIRRRLREALRTLGESKMRSDHDYVVVASRAAHDYPFAGLQDALREAFDRLDRQAERGSGRGGRKTARPPGAPRSVLTGEVSTGSVPTESMPTDVDRPTGGDGAAGEVHEPGAAAVPNETAPGPRPARSARRRGR